MNSRAARNPFISVVIPLRNEARYIEACLTGIYSQSYPLSMTEVVVVDNCSDDGSYEAASALIASHPTGQIVRFEGSSIGAVRNFGFGLTKGEIVAFLDGDSVPDPNWLDSVATAFSHQPETGCIGFAMKRPGDGVPWFVRDWFEVTDGQRSHGVASVDWVPSFNLAVRRELFEAIGGFDEVLIAGEDFDLGHRLAERSDVIRSDQSFVDHLGTTDDLISFFRKERWRGLGTVGLLALRENRLKVAARLAIPMFYVFALFSVLAFAALAGIESLSIKLAIPSLAAISGIPVVLALRARVSGIGRKIRVSYLYSIFLVARGLAAYEALWKAMRR